MFQSIGLHKFSEEDIWADGCQPDTQESSHIDYTFTGKTAEEVIKKIADYLGVADGGKDNGVERNACEEPGRVDFATTEDADGTRLSPRQWKEFKAGKIKAWYCIYTAYIEQTTPANL
jgi:hypothetical protein